MNFCFVNKIFNNRNKAKGCVSKIESIPQYSLTPLPIDKYITTKDGIREINPAYQPVFDIAKKIEEDNIKNIAITGPFGSGKSSVLLSLQQDFPQYKYLPISLATLDGFIDKREIDNSSDNKGGNELDCDEITKNDEALNRKIEYSILQQLIYRESANKIPQSRFKRIKHISKCKSALYAFGTILLVIACFVLFDPKILRVQSLHDFFSCTPKWKVVWDILFSIYVILFFGFWIRKTIIAVYNNRINKLNFKDGEIEIAESTSIFNKHLDEIIYFFEVTKYDVVIIEDLDRFDTHNIFLKLRELNNLLNNSKSIERSLGKIVFIYAIRDDIFKDTDRTKFFDYITTVIPVINTSNSKDKLHNALKEMGVDNISDDVCMDLGIFIDDMRILKNIVNEYRQYSHKLNKLEQLSPEKMLGMILYKNYHPDDFVKLHNQKGIVHNILSNRIKYHNSNIKEIDAEITSLKEERKQIVNYHYDIVIKELRAIYVMKYVTMLPGIKYFKEGRYDDRQYTFNQLIDSEEIFEKLEQNMFLYYETSQGGTSQLGLKFKDIEEKINPGMTYRARVNLMPHRIVDIDNRLKELEEETIEKRTLPLHKILQSYSAEDFFEDAKENKLIAFLIKAGYIDESYYDYISYFYPGVLAPSDKEFILDIKIGRTKEYDYKIYKTKALINEIHESLFSRIEILNINILDFLVANKNEYKQKYIALQRSIIKNKAFDFIRSYYLQGNEIDAFFSEIFTIWISFFSEAILVEKNTESRFLYFEIFLKFFPLSKISNFNNEKFKRFFANSFDFIAKKYEVIGIDTIEKILTQLKIKFVEINSEIENTNLFVELVINGQHFELTSNNISNLIKIVYPNSFQYFADSSFSSILDTNNPQLIKYITNNLELSIDKVFLETSSEETPDAILLIINDEEINSDKKNAYLLKQKNCIESLEEINEEFWDNAFICNVIEPTWANMEKFILKNDNEIPDIILDFIEINSYSLSKQKANEVLSEEIEEKLFNKIFGSNYLSIESYQQLIKSFDSSFTSLDLTPLDGNKVKVLIENDKLDFNLDFYKQINVNFSDLLLSFILRNKKEYFSNLNLYPLSSQLAVGLLNSELLIGNEKIQVLKSISKDLFEKDNELATLSGKFIVSQSDIIVSKEVLLSIIKGCTHLELKLDILIKASKVIQGVKDVNSIDDFWDDMDFVKSSLMSIGGDYAIIANQKGHRRLFKKSKKNEDLFIFLNKHDFISSFNEEDGMIRVNAKNIK